MGKATGIAIDFMKKEDLDQVMAIEQASFSMPWSRTLFLSEFRSPSVSRLLVELAPDATVRTITGYLVFWLVAGEMHILNLATVPGSRRQGIARSLVLPGSCMGTRKTPDAPSLRSAFRTNPPASSIPALASPAPPSGVIIMMTRSRTLF